LQAAAAAPQPSPAETMVEYTEEFETDSETMVEYTEEFETDSEAHRTAPRMAQLQPWAHPNAPNPNTPSQMVSHSAGSSRSDAGSAPVQRRGGYQFDANASVLDHPLHEPNPTPTSARVLYGEHPPAPVCWIHVLSL
jgi:hypothetical protein